MDTGGFVPPGITAGPVTDEEIKAAAIRIGFTEYVLNNLPDWVMVVDGIISLRGPTQVDRAMVEEIPLPEHAEAWDNGYWVCDFGVEVNEDHWLDTGYIRIERTKAESHA